MKFLSRPEVPDPISNAHASNKKYVDDSVTPGGAGFRGAHVTKTSNQVVANNTLTKPTWQTVEYDTEGFFSAGSPTRFTIPSGKSITRVRLTFGAELQAEALNRGRISFYRNNSDTFLGNVRQDVSCGWRSLSIQSHVIPVSPGDYFEAQLFHTHGGDRELRAIATTSFSIEVVE